MTLVVVVPHGGVLLAPLPGPGLLLPHAGAGPVSCRHLSRQPGLGLLLLLVTEVLKPSFDLEFQEKKIRGDPVILFYFNTKII